MAMNKTEQARMAQLERAVAMAKAMHWPAYSSPAPMTGVEIESSLAEGGIRYGRPQMVARGWFANSYQKGDVSLGCSNGINHNSNGDSTTTQGMGRMFATEADAWRVIRLELTERYAENLARIDAKIKRAESDQ